MSTVQCMHKQGEVYETEEERIKGRRAANLRYAEQPYSCYICKLTMRRSNKWNHERTEKHKRNFLSN